MWTSVSPYPRPRPRSCPCCGARAADAFEALLSEHVPDEVLERAALGALHQGALRLVAGAEPGGQVPRARRVVARLLEPGAYTRSLQSSTWGPSGHIAHARAQLEHLRATSAD